MGPYATIAREVATAMLPVAAVFVLLALVTKRAAVFAAAVNSQRTDSAPPAPREWMT